MSTNQYVEEAEYFVSQAKRELERFPRRQLPTYQGQPLVRIADTWVTPETAAEFLSEQAA